MGCLGVRWVLLGGTSGPTVPTTDVGLLRATLAACREVGIAPFLKQLGSRPTLEGAPVPIRHAKGGNWNEWPEDLRIREYPRP